jgi:uncharacterized protein (DUF2384 family)
VSDRANAEENLLHELQRLHAELGLTSADLAAAVGVGRRTVDRWLDGRTRPHSRARRHLRELLEVHDHARDTFSTPEAPRDWFQAPQRYLGWLSPAEAIRAGRFDRVVGALEVLDSGIFI